MLNTFRTRMLAAAAVVVAIIATPAVLLAHAHLVASSPAANARLATAPTSLRLHYSEAPEVALTVLKLLDSAGAAVPLGSVSALPGDATSITAAISRPLANGTYTVVWRTAASDGHASNGRFTFVVAQAVSAAPTAPESSAATPPPVIIHRITPNPVVSATSTVGMPTGARWVELVALLTVIGAVAYRLFVLGEASLAPAVTADSGDRSRRLAQSALVLFALATLTRLGAESVLIANPGMGRGEAMLSVVRDTRWGHAWMVGAVGVMLGFAGLTAARRGIVGWATAGIAVALIATSASLTGHAGASTHYLPLAVSVDVAHLLGAGAWLGGLTALMLCGFPALRGMSEQARPAAGSALVRAYHRSATDGVTVVLVTAVISAWLRLGAINALWTTTYGRILILKIGLVLIVIAFGAFHWRTAVLPEWTPDTKFRFQRSALAELVVGALVIAVTAVLIGTNLPMR